MKSLCNNTGLEIEVIELIPVHEDIKLGKPTLDKRIANYAQNIINCGKVGVKCVCYNFMPVFDWFRTNLYFKHADGHQYGEWITVKEPTCVDLGKDERTCSVCSYVDGRDIDALGHSYKDTVVNPSCTERGNTVHKCERCGHTYTDSYITATCEENGYTLHTCLSCGNEYKDNIVPATGHDYATEVVRERI